jgi:hypothetical protein
MTPATPANWKRAGFYLAVGIFGVAIGTLLSIPVLAIAGGIVSFPGVARWINQLLTPVSDALLFWFLLASSWALGVALIYVMVSFALRWRDPDDGVE